MDSLPLTRLKHVSNVLQPSRDRHLCRGRDSSVHLNVKPVRFSAKQHTPLDIVLSGRIEVLVSLLLSALQVCVFCCTDAILYMYGMY